MSKAVNIQTTSPPVVQMLTPEEENLVHLLAHSIVNFSLQQHESNQIHPVQQRRPK